MIESKVSSKYQLTLPAEVRKALGVKPGDAVRYEVEGKSVRVSVVRPDLGDVLTACWPIMTSQHWETRPTMTRPVTSAKNVA